MDERRRYRRHPVEGIHGKVFLASEKDIHVKVKKMSYGGMLLDAALELTPGDVFPMEVTLSGKPVRFFAKIASAVKLPSGSYDVGVQFKELSAETRSAIDDFVGALERK